MQDEMLLIFFFFLLETCQAFINRTLQLNRDEVQISLKRINVLKFSFQVYAAVCHFPKYHVNSEFARTKWHQKALMKNINSISSPSLSRVTPDLKAGCLIPASWLNWHYLDLKVYFCLTLRGS